MESVLKSIRSRLGATQCALADALCVTPANISHIETGKQSLSVELAKRLVEYAKTKGVSVTLDEIYGGGK